MRLRRLFVLLLIIFAVISIRFPDAFQLLGAKVRFLPLTLPVYDIAADAEVRSAEEFHAIMLDAIREVKDVTKVRIVNYDEKAYDVDTAFKSILSENVGLGFVSGCNATFTRALGRSWADVKLELQYQYPRDKIISMRAEMDKKANEIINNIITPGMNDYEKVLAVHDYVVKCSRYDRLNADADTVPAEEHEAYGVLVNGIGVCDSYAKAVKLLLEKAGAQTIIVEGSKVGTAEQGLAGADHAWNIVKLDGEYYHVDATWDDVSEERDSLELVYHHFNLNDEEMQKTHIWNKGKYPPCISTRYNYFEYNKLIAHDRAEFLSMLAKAVSDREKKLLIKIADYEGSAYNIEGLIKKAAEKSRPGKFISAKWIINDSLGVIDIEFEY